MSKVNTLFSYFNKSPKGNSPSQNTTSENSLSSLKNAVESPKNANVNKSKKPPPERNGSRLTKEKLPVHKKDENSENLGRIDTVCEYELYDLVWAKLEGFPFWPALICSPPGQDKVTFQRGSKNGTEMHVQFFDQPPTRSWIKIRYVKKLIGPKHPDIPTMKDMKWKHGVEDACKVLETDRAMRCTLVVEHLASDNETGDFSDADGHSDAENDVSLSNREKLPGDNTNKSGKKRRRIVLQDDSESEDEYKPCISENESTVSSEDENYLSLHETDEESSPVQTLKRNKAKKRKPNPVLSHPSPSTPKTLTFPTLKTSTSKTSSVKRAKTQSPSNSKKLAFPSSFQTPGTSKTQAFPTPVRDSTISRLSLFASDDDPSRVVKEGKLWTHLKLDWLKPDRIKDIKGNPKGHPDYDPRTVFVPNDFKLTHTPAMRQWWDLKSKHFDTILFFKVGKFYELYHMDAVTGINELNLREMAGDFAHSGFPEISYGRYSSMLLEKGYKVARVEQTETPQMMEERCKNLSRPNKYDKVVNREICGVTTKGTCTFGVQDGEIVTAGHNFLLSLAEKEMTNGNSIYGICFVDTSIGKFYIGELPDDRHCSRLRTLIAHFPPAQVLYERNCSSAKTQSVLNGCLNSVLKESLRSGSEFWGASKTLKHLLETGYFKGGDENCLWPSALKKMIDPNDSLDLTPHKKYEHALKALGACTWYLKHCLIDEELLSMKNFEEYVPPDEENVTVTSSPVSWQHMVLDGITLRNLEVLENNYGASEGSLLETMECCNTPFGKRLFRQWMCSPLCHIDSINDRLDAVEDLQKTQGIFEDLTKTMKKIPDLERLLSRIHTMGSARRSEIHPDSRAVFYEDGVYSKRKIGYLLNALQGFKLALEVNHLINDPKIEFSSTILKDIVLKKEEGGRFPNLKKVLTFFDNAFDHEKAKREGRIEPSRGVDDDYDSAEDDMTEIKQKLDQYLEKQRKHFGCKVTFFSSGKNRYQLEIPEHAFKSANNSYELVSSKKGFKRYWTSEIKSILPKLVAAEERKEAALKDIMRRLFHQFDKHYKKWESAVSCLSVLDVLLSLVQYSVNSQVNMCRPQFLSSENALTPILRIKDGSHPALIKFLSGGDFIPNGISVGSTESSEESQLVLVTGPNMGGKSTLMRQVGLLTIMAQMGSFVPAEEFKLTPVDRVFTRLGASDRIMEGESTFFVELSETASILKHATKHSLVLMDELGRGTATYDGTAIACAVAQDLACRLKCRTLFSTHYHSLVDHFSSNPNVKLGHMACMVENENVEDPTQETITFLYKFVGGSCPKSYGFNAARLAGIPDQIIRAGHQKAKEFEEKCNRMKTLRLLFTSHTSKDLTLVQEQIKCK